jgi:hypothetical protein
MPDRYEQLTHKAFELLDTMVREMAFALDESEFKFANDPFHYWINAHGLPKTANEARIMFEFAMRWTEFIFSVEDVAR